MKLAGGLIGMAMALCCAAEAKAQVLILPVRLDGAPFGIGRGVSVTHRRGVTISAYLTSGLVGPYSARSFGLAHYFGPVDSRIAINYYAPRPIVLTPPDDLAGVDLDVVRPPWSLAPREAVPPPRKEPDAALPGVDVSVPREPVRPAPASPDKMPQPEPPPPKPAAPPPRREQPLDEAGQLVQLGQAAFARQQYGLAALRFRQASTADPVAARPHFLLAQAHFALGKYGDAVAAIHAGMRLQADWPQNPFRPRLELYQGKEADFDWHLQRLATVLSKNPEDATFLFLLGYQLWFDGQRMEALPLFLRARPSAENPAFIDRFLKAAAPGPMVAN
jgi:hypothetical protein